MESPTGKRLSFGDGIRAGIPVFIGYFPIAITFGLLSTDVVSLFHSLSLSIFVFAGASQFVALRLMMAQARAAEIVVVTFLINFRHLIMSGAISHRLVARGRRWAALIAFGLTDETFAVAATGENPPTVPYFMGLELLAYTGWVSGTGLGYVGGSLLPSDLQAGMGIALYALFTALLVPHLRKSLRTAVIALSAAVLSTALHRLLHLQIGWSIVIAILLPSGMGALFAGGDEE
jgi:4-azaleucine resistance transporter AzlC